MVQDMKGALLRGVLATGLAMAIMFVPLPEEWPQWASWAQVGVAALVIVIILGKLLYDTLFYDRYWP
ncbi:MAG: hypothetical protein HYU86_05995 [Chloroflexi bacterium]|nr:hypothetical protein [Chloroflexota bacterium]